jgi:Flp pilus assembly protein TadG
MKTLFRRNGKSQRGAAQIEFALCMLVTVFLIFWVFEMMMVVYTYAVLSDAAKEGVRYAIVHGNDVASPSGPGNVGNVQTIVTGYAQYALHDISAMPAPTVSYPDASPGNKAGERVQVSLTYTYVPYITLPFTAPSITTTAQGRIVY